MNRMFTAQLTTVRCAFATLSVSLLLASCNSVQETGTPVLTLADSGAGSLRDLLAAAAPGDTLRFATTGTLTLGSTLIIDKNITLLADGVTIDAGGKGRALDVSKDATVSIKGGTWKGGTGQNFGPTSLRTTSLNTTRNYEVLAGTGRMDGGSAQNLTPQAEPLTAGGVIQNMGTLTLENVTVTGGTANIGGGISNAVEATLILKTGVNITGNQAVLQADVTAPAGYGGGVYNSGTLLVAGGSINSNTAVNEGGGIRNTRSGKLTIESGSVDGNRVTLPLVSTNNQFTGSAGGGIYSSGDLTMTGGSVSNNAATFFGGGLAVQRFTPPGATQAVIPTLTLSGGTIAGNTAGNATNGAGGGLWNGGKLTMTGGTFKANTAFYGGGIQSWGTLSVTGGNVEGNTAKYGGGINAYRPDSADYPSTFAFGGTATVKGNTASDAGGGVFVDRLPLTMTSGTVEGNTAVKTGGGITLSSGTVSTVSGGVISGNKVTGNTDGGGGLRLYSGTTLNLSGGEVRDNTAVKTGGGVTVGGTLNMAGGTIQGNTVTDRTAGVGGGGGGVRLYAGSSMTASGGTIKDNTAWYGGGVETNGAYQTSPTSTFTLSGATISGNTADGNVGGGFWNDGQLIVTSGSVTGNSARDGGGVFNTKVSVYSKTGGSVSGNMPNDVVQGQ